MNLQSTKSSLLSKPVDSLHYLAVLNALEEDTNLASKVGDCNEELESPFNDAVLVHKDENEETELEVLEEPRASILGQSSEMADELAIVSEPQKPGCKTDNQSISGMQTADAATHDKAIQELSENLEARPVCDVIVQEGDGAKLAPVENSTDKKIERNHGATSLIDSGELILTFQYFGSARNEYTCCL